MTDHPAVHPAVMQVDGLAAELLDEARHQHTRRTSRTLVTGTPQRVTLVALAEGTDLAEHRAPSAATLFVVSGRVPLHTHDQDWVLDAGQLLTIPPQRHGLTAHTDAAVLLTVALR
ncbi:MAG: cupin domain-containing protein [Actinophytocola sp.]|uniref:cupin domain-containing protein n=1 Tax=Actinophytocola sp. TaxID=1872138 RepID=UPI00132AC69C|nr:cupin domain-containing protein [Actinophytocola sp.]MPZ86444.1 cupin domain-containing protein [Actinophytocola sp.]